MATRKSGTKKPAARTAGKTSGAKPSKRTARPAVPKRKEPQTLRLRAFTPGFTVNDIARSVAWYRDVLGFIVADEWRAKGVLRGAEMKAGAVTLYLGQDDWKKGTDRSKGAGFRLYCTTAQDVDHLAALVKSRGGVLAHEPQTQPWGERDFGLVDPDGFNITITGG
jgi:uncharacterized glyoxalase superfamily protein PhnB